jgi:hypothetical protein
MGDEDDRALSASWIDAPAEVAQSAELTAPALGVPMTTVVGSVLRHDHQVPDSGANHVIASRAAVLLLTTDVSNVVPGRRGPVRGVGTRGRRVGLGEELRVTAVAARHG